MKSVKNQSKQKYTPCELNVLEFTVENEFGGVNSNPSAAPQGNFGIHAQAFRMGIGSGNGGGFYNKNAQYGGGQDGNGVDMESYF